MSDTGTKSSGIGFTGLLALLFIGLKLGHVINWSWLWVLAPIWMSAAVGLFCLVVVVAVYLVTKD